MVTASFTLTGALWALNILFSNTALPAASVYLGAFSTTPSATGGAEFNGAGWPGYQRVAIAGWAPPFSAVPGTIGVPTIATNAATVLLPPTSGTASVVGLGIWLTAFGGGPVAFATLSAPLPVGPALGGVLLAAGALSLTLAPGTLGTLSPPYAMRLLSAFTRQAPFTPLPLSALLLRTGYSADQYYPDAFALSTVPQPLYEAGYAGYARVPVSGPSFALNSSFPALATTTNDVTWPASAEVASYALGGWGLVDSADVLVLGGNLAAGNGQPLPAGDAPTLPGGSAVLQVGA